MPEHIIKASYSENTIRVYQAYSSNIALPALEAGKFVSPFKMTRMTWIKPSFNWMMYRSGYATKPGQEVVLGIDITRQGFEWALEHSTLSSFTPEVHTSFDEWQMPLKTKPVRIQWDPERDCWLNIINDVRSIQIGLSGPAVDYYVHEWIVHIDNVTDTAHRLAADLARGVTPERLPDQLEVSYPLSPALQLELCRD
jgi:hypothetical protein